MVLFFGANLVQPVSEFPETSFLCGFSVVLLVQIWLSPLSEMPQSPCKSRVLGFFFCCFFVCACLRRFFSSILVLLWVILWASRELLALFYF